MGNVNPKLAWTKGNRLLHDARQMLKDVRAAVDPREVAGGIVGLTAGEVLGGAVGGIAGAAVAGPVGAIVGAEVGAFAAGTLGLKFGTDAVRDFAGTPAADGAPPDGQAEAATGSYLKRTSEGRYGQVVGLASGASMGRIVAGRSGGLIGGLIGEAAGGQADAAATGNTPADASSGAPRQKPAEWLDRFGKNTAGEAATVLVAGTIGSIFGSGGRAVGQRLGLIIGTQIAWHKLAPSPWQARLLAAPPAPGGESALPDNRQAPAEGGPDPGDVSAVTSACGPSSATVVPSALSRHDVEVLLLIAASMRNNASSAPLAVLPAVMQPGCILTGRSI